MSDIIDMNPQQQFAYTSHLERFGELQKEYQIKLEAANIQLETADKQLKANNALIEIKNALIEELKEGLRIKNIKSIYT